jgi:predicted phosphodiesterase
MKVVNERLENEGLLEYFTRITENKELMDLDYSEWAEILCGKHYASENGRKAFYVVEPMLQRLKNEIENKNSDEGYIKCLILNDLHIPYQRDDVLTEIEKYRNVDYIILGGDTIDCESCSSFDVKDRPSVEEELVATHEFLSKINEIVNSEKTKIIAIRGNHEYRYSKEIIKLQEKQLQKMLNPNLLSMIQNGFTYYEKNKDITYKPISNFEYIDDWKVRLFDNLIVAHPTDFSGIDGKMCEKVSEHFLNRHMAEADDVLIFGHTHKFSNLKVNRRQGMFVVENSCMCKPMSYADAGKLGYNPQNYGYTYLKFKEGQKIDINDIKIVHLG